MILSKVETHLFFSKDEAKKKIEEAEASGYMVEHNLKEKTKYEQEYYLVKIKEEFDTEAAIMAQFKDKI